MALPITALKVESVTPTRWADFRGFSLLFDSDPSAPFYQALTEGMELMGPKALVEKYMYCPLPPPSFHVTAWDGGNAGNLSETLPAWRTEHQELLRGLPDSEANGSPLLELPRVSRLAQTRWDLRLKFRGFEREPGGIFAELMPADTESESELKRMVAAREELTLEFKTKFGFGPPEPYGPHVSLGYFANDDLAVEAAGKVDVWDKIMRERMAGEMLTLRDVDLYGFMDMGAFFKL